VQPGEFASWVAGQQRPATFGATATTVPAPASAPTVAQPAPSGAQLASLPVGYTFPHDQPEFAYAKPNTPIPADLKFTKGLTGSAARGMQVYSSAACIGCHTVKGNPSSVGVIGPNLTHFGSRSTIGAGNFPNTPAYLALWIKNARKMKPGVIMPTLGLNEYDPQLKKPVEKAMGGLDDQQIADIVAYLSSLK
ncbi:MAG TPA: c-type cytochrome, partial [Gemmatimonadaceae bacterium]|nr:c-type cytochrome [Gemmatimonadaceae bacterium]